MSFGVRTVYLDGDVELAVRGEIDLSVAEQFWNAIEEAMSPDRPLVLDMQEVTFFDSSGLLALLRALSKLNQDPTKLILRSPSPVVMRVLRVTDLDQRMTIQDRGDDMEPTKHALN
jgi:anti-sigma B factor antagonist